MASANQTLLMLASTQAMLSLSPGPNWILIIQNSMHDRKLGLATAAAIPLVVTGMATLSMIGGSALLVTFPSLPIILGIVCGGYLTYIGIRSLLSSLDADPKIAWTRSAPPSLKAAFMMGFFSTITNPKAIVFFASIFTATSAYSLPIPYKVAVIFLMPLVSFACNASLALLTSSSVARERFAVLGHWSKRIGGIVMIGFGVYMLIGLIKL